MKKKEQKMAGRKKDFSVCRLEFVRFNGQDVITTSAFETPDVIFGFDDEGNPITSQD